MKRSFQSSGELCWEAQGSAAPQTGFERQVVLTPHSSPTHSLLQNRRWCVQLGMVVGDGLLQPGCEGVVVARRWQELAREECRRRLRP